MNRASSIVEACPDCKRRNKCKKDCGIDGCACRQLCEVCEKRIDRVVARRWAYDVRQERLL